MKKNEGEDGRRGSVGENTEKEIFARKTRGRR